MNRKPIVISMGEPAGINTEILVLVLNRKSFHQSVGFVGMNVEVLKN